MNPIFVPRLKPLGKKFSGSARVCWGLGHQTLGECVINMEWNYIDHKLGVFVQSPLSPLFSSAKIFFPKKERGEDWF
jgi:hypothetical protein